MSQGPDESNCPMRVFILSNTDLTSNLIFSRLFEVPEINVVGVGFTATVASNRGGLAGALAVLKKTDFRYWLYLLISNGLFAGYDAVACRLGRQSAADWPRSLRAECRARGVPVYRSADFNAADFVDRVKQSQPDLVLIRVNQILKAPLLSIPRFGTWCVHSSLLPAYKGIAGEFHAIRNRETRIGSTVFEVTEELDAGRPLFQTALTVDAGQSIFQHMVRNNLQAAELLAREVARLGRTGRVSAQLVSPAPRPSYHSWPKPEQVRTFSEQGGRLMTLGDLAGYIQRAFLSRWQPALAENLRNPARTVE